MHCLVSDVISACPLEQVLRTCATLKISVFLVMQHGQDDFYIFFNHSQVVVGCCPTSQAIYYLVFPDASLLMQYIYVRKEFC